MYTDIQTVELTRPYFVDAYRQEPSAQVFSLGPVDARIAELADGCRKLLDLPENWNSYRSKRVDENLLGDGIRLLSLLLSPRVRTPDVVPTARGGVQLEWHAPHQDLEIEVRGLGHYRVFHRRLDAEKEVDVFDDISTLLPLVRDFPA